MSLPALKLEIADRYAVVTFDQPEGKLNLLTRAFWLELKSALDSLASEKSLKGMILQSGKPGVFLAGADLKELQFRGPDDRPRIVEFMDLGRAALDMIEQLPFPTAALIDGICLGGGLELALACDLRIEGTDPKIQIGFPEVKLGLIPGWGGTQRTARLLDTEHAATMICGGEPVPRLFNWKNDSHRILESAKSLIDSSSGSFRTARHRRFDPKNDYFSLEEATLYSVDAVRQTAIKEAIRVIKDGVGKPLAAALDLEREAFMNLVASDGVQARIAEFFNRRSGA